MFVDRPPRAETKAERWDPGRLEGDTTEASQKLLPEFGEPYCVRSATENVICTDWDGVATSVAAERFTKVQTGRRAL